MTEEDKFQRLLSIMARLRGTDGCPWDREQSHESLRPYVIEEAYEVLEALDSGDAGDLCEELGDLLLQVVFHAQIATEAGRFTIDDVLAAINKKLIRRHPHVFQSSSAATAEQVVSQWHEIKQGEKADSSILSRVPKSLPALYYSYGVQKKAAQVGFDWPGVKEVLGKVDEELDELKACLDEADHDQSSIAGELGDVLFALANLGRHLRINPEMALHDVSRKFKERFGVIEAAAVDSGRDVADLSFEEMEELWQKARDEEGRA